ncbi:MAG TPA: iron-containing alcohol dehydrogenase, partial [Candidatus Limnocylindrales bacterium]
MTALSDRTIDLLVRDRTRFGAGAIDGLAAVIREIGGGPDARAFIVSDPGVVAAGVTATVAGILAEDGMDTTVFGAVEPNPGMRVVERGGTELRAFGIDDVIVVAVGGGSTMDTAKALSLYATNDVGVA